MPADPQFDKVSDLAKAVSPFYGCHSKPRPVEGSPVPTKPDQPSYPFRFKTQCMYDKGLTDPRCAGCPHINPNLP